MIKFCKYCSKTQQFDMFSKNLARPDKLNDKCKNCHKLYRIKNHQKRLEIEQKSKKKNKEQRKIYNKWYKQSHKHEIYEKDKIYRKNYPEIRKNIAKRYRDKNKIKILKWQYDYAKKRRKIDPLFNMQQKLRSGFYDYIKRSDRRVSKTFLNYLGCSPTELKQYLTNQLTGEMTWEKYLSAEIVIDHIIPYPCLDFNYEEDIHDYANFKNLRPLWKDENTKKSALDQKLGKLYKTINRTAQKLINNKILEYVKTNHPNYESLNQFVNQLLETVTPLGGEYSKHPHL